MISRWCVSSRQKNKGIIDRLGNSTALTQNTSATSGVRVTVGGKKDSYKFTATVDTGNRFGTLTMINQYVVNHQVRKYTPATLGTSTNNKLNQVIFNSGGNKLAWVTGYDAILKVYPEVNYKYYQVGKGDNNQYVQDSLIRRDVVVLGEKPRTTKPVALNGLLLLGNNLTGEVVSNGALSGQTQGSGLVVPQGVDITMKADGNASFKLVSYVLDLDDKLKVGNSFSAVNEHNNYVNTFLSGVTFKTKLQVGTKEFDTNATVNSEKGASTTGTFFMEFKGGKLTDVTKVAVIRDMQATYGISYDQATAMFNNSGIEQQLQAMFETKNSATNKSLNKWYDEESTLIVIHKYTTDVTFNNIFSQDKIDYGTVTTNGTSTSGATKHKTVDAYYKIKVELPSNFMGANLGNQATIVPEAEISGTRFKVSSSTTSDFDSNFGWN